MGFITEFHGADRLDLEVDSWKRHNHPGTINTNITGVAVVVPGPYRLGNAGRQARTRMILRIILTRSYYFPVPPRLKPVNSPAESRALVVAGNAPRSGRAPTPDRQRPAWHGKNRDCTGNNRDGTLYRDSLCRGLFWPRWSYGAVPVVPGAVLVAPSATPVVAGDSRFIPEFITVEHRCLITHRGSASIRCNCPSTQSVGDDGSSARVVAFVQEGDLVREFPLCCLLTVDDSARLTRGHVQVEKVRGYQA
ncbi:hypothetical protein DPMN_191627 [Dreissena polymorpha]|uniref:Uncharacterized protein n=1 Tax=Dreissena polymorpha TaxID=45954 RepID=A0A9D3Y3C6_DREPO|nr:hypothetical protein DPMN_191627 [Dreissena polymorpha]